MKAAVLHQSALKRLPVWGHRRVKLTFQSAHLLPVLRICLSVFDYLIDTLAVMLSNI